MHKMSFVQQDIANQVLELCELLSHFRPLVERLFNPAAKDWPLIS